MKFVPLILHISFFVVVVISAAITIPIHEASANDFLFDSRNPVEDKLYGPPPPPPEPQDKLNLLCCIANFEQPYGPPAPPLNDLQQICCLTKNEDYPSWETDFFSSGDYHQLTVCHESGFYAGGGVTTTAEGEPLSECLVFGWRGSL